jgi:hypothetical protein
MLSAQAWERAADTEALPQSRVFGQRHGTALAACSGVALPNPWLRMIQVPYPSRCDAYLLCPLAQVILMTLVPPAEWKGGYPCFAAAPACIIGIVYLMAEAGELFGCIVGLKDIMTGVSIVAMGEEDEDAAWASALSQKRVGACAYRELSCVHVARTTYATMSSHETSMRCVGRYSGDGCNGLAALLIGRECWGITLAHARQQRPAWQEAARSNHGCNARTCVGRVVVGLLHGGTGGSAAVPQGSNKALPPLLCWCV